MSDSATATLVSQATTKISGWVKTTLGTIAGLVSGAVMMYASPLVDYVVKPAKPLANFSADAAGLTVTFNNRSSGSGEGWWDFGDGSPLEPVSSTQETIAHAYPSPGNYVAKLTMRNFIGDQNDRTINLQLDNAQSQPPTIQAIDAVPLIPAAYAPATFVVTSKAKNAKLCVWDLGDDRPLEINTESPNNQNRLMTFNKPGGYMIKLAAVNGDKAAEKSTIVYVDEPPPGTLTAILSVADQATRVERIDTIVPVTAAFPPNYKESSYQFERPVPARPGYEIVDARLEIINDGGARGLALKLAEDRRSARLTGELVQQTGFLQKKGAPPTVLVRAVLTQESRTAATRPAVPVAATLSLPGTVSVPLPPLPPNWVEPHRQFRLELRDGDRILWPAGSLPHNAPITYQNRTYKLSAFADSAQVRVQLVEAAAAPMASMPATR